MIAEKQRNFLKKFAIKNIMLYNRFKQATKLDAQQG
jgi:hypothetical protein